MKNDEPEDRIRLNLAVSAQVKERLDRLQRTSDAASITEVIRRALAVYEDLLNVRKGGAKVVVEHRGGTKEVLRLI
jgi:Ribbon-helix-helix protein, copG family